MPEVLPSSRRERDSWVVGLRGARDELDASQPYGFSLEKERAATGQIVNVATLLLTNRECPWRCVMCDLWRHTLPHSVAAGAIPAQIRYALARLGRAEHIKLYNSGSFFDNAAIPAGDDAAIAAELTPFKHVVVESHPALVGERCFRLRDRLRGTLEVAMGLETVHPDALEKLNKGVTLASFAAAAERLHREGIALRVFVLVGVPFVPAGEAVDWAVRSVRFAWQCGASAVSLIGTRGGNGAMEQLRAGGQFVPATVACVEQAFAQALAERQGRVFADTWQLGELATCTACTPARVARLERMNLSQQLVPAVACPVCGLGGLR